MGDVSMTVDAVKRAYVAHVVGLCKGNRNEAARILGVDRKTLYRNMRRWKLIPKGTPE